MGIHARDGGGGGGLEGASQVSNSVNIPGMCVRIKCNDWNVTDRPSQGIV